MNSLRKFDQFGVPFQLRTSAGNKAYKSWIGGFLTLILYTLCLLYTIYIFILWSNGSILPKVSSQLSPSTSLKMSLSESFMKFSFALRNQSNPFTKSNNILMPLLLTENNGDFKNITSLFSESTEINLPNVQLVKNNINEKEEVTVIFVLCPCNKQFQLGQTCASDQEIDEFLNSFSTFVTIFGQLQQYNPSENQLDSISKDTILSFENSYILYNQIKLQSTNKLHDNGILFQNFESERYLNNINILSQIISKGFSKKNFQGLDPVFITLIRLDELETVTTVVDVKIGELFAQIGSIISVLLSLQLVASFYNQNRQTEELIESILVQLFPKLKDVDIKKDILGHLSTVSLNGEPLNKYKFNTKYQQVRIIALQYLSINSLIHKIILLEKKLNIPFDDLRLGSFHSVKFNQIVQESDAYQTPKEKTNSVSLIFDNELQD